MKLDSRPSLGSAIPLSSCSFYLAQKGPGVRGGPPGVGVGAHRGGPAGSGKSRFAGRWVLAAIIATGLATTASATTTVVNSLFFGLSARAELFEVTPDGCVGTLTSAYLFENTGAGGAFALIHAYRARYCPPADIYEVIAQIPLSSGEFTIDHTLGRATLKVAIPAQDLVSGAAITLNVDLTWTATDAPFVSRDVFTSVDSSGSRFLYRSFGTMRPAAVSGMISDQTSLVSASFTPDTAEGSIEDVKTGTVLLTR